MTPMSPRRIAALVLSTAVLALPLATMAPVAGAAAKKPYTNCTTLNAKYPHGVGKAGAKDKTTGKAKPVTTFTKSTTIYKAAMKANRRLDRDKDGVACEKR